MRCDSGGTRGRVLNQANAHPRQEGHNASKSGHRAGKKVQWEHYGPEEDTWELEDAMRLAHPFLFNSVEH